MLTTLMLQAYVYVVSTTIVYANGHNGGGKIDPCLGVKVVKGPVNGITNNLLNLFREYDWQILTVLFIIAVFASVAGRGGVWWKRLAIIMLAVFVLAAFISATKGAGANSGC